MRLDVPAVVSFKVAMLSRVTVQRISDAESSLRHTISGMLVTSACLESTDTELRKTCLIIEEAFRITAGAINFKVDDGVHVCAEDRFVVGVHSVEHKVYLLVKVDLVRRCVQELWCVAHVVMHLAFAFDLFRTR